MYYLLICVFLFGGLCVGIKGLLENYSEYNILNNLEKSCQGSVEGEILSCDKEIRRIDTEHDIERNEDTDFTVYYFTMGYIVNNKDYQLRTETLRVKNVAINNNEVSNIGDKVQIKYNLDNPSQSYCFLFEKERKAQLKILLLSNIFLCCSVIFLSILGFYFI